MDIIQAEITAWQVLKKAKQQSESQDIAQADISQAEIIAYPASEGVRDFV